ncbi:MAG TPA: HNH endonuclease [Pirellulales bacterium]|jgi:5-methylcytosine-specific restriction endonuclease McrA|nr:HNH endonuclease [Pirellulales bacterium]
MTISAEDLRRDVLTAAFRMPSVQSMVGRKSSITNAFVSAIIPLIPPSLDEIEYALAVLKMDPRDVRCAYCGNLCTEWDHLRPLVIKRRPTGYISEIANLVPACGKCNQSKGNKQWRDWMLSNAKHSPTGRKLADVTARSERLASFEKWRTPTRVDFEAIIGCDKWEQYWRLCEDVVAELHRSQEVADQLRILVLEALNPSAAGSRR